MTTTTIPRAEYQAIAAINWSAIEGGFIDGEFSPLHYKHAIAQPDEETDAMREGTALHMALLEPERFERDVVVMPEFNRRTTKGREDYEAFVAARFGIDAVKASVPIWKRERWRDGEDWGLGSRTLVTAGDVGAHLIDGDAHVIGDADNDPPGGVRP